MKNIITQLGSSLCWFHSMQLFSFAPSAGPHVWMSQYASKSDTNYTNNVNIVQDKITKSLCCSLIVETQ